MLRSLATGSSTSGEALDDNPATAPPFRGPRVHSNVARPARNVAAGPPRPPSYQCGLRRPVWSLGLSLIGGPDPREFFQAGFERGLFRRLAAPRRPLIGRPDSNGLALPRFCRRIFWSTGGRHSACKRVRVLRVSYRVLNCKKRRARGKLQDGRPRMPAAPASPRTASSLPPFFAQPA